NQVVGMIFETLNCDASRALLELCYRTTMNKIFLAAAALGCLTGGGVLAEDEMTGTVKPFGSVPFAPDRDVACLSSALETGDPLTGPSTWILKAPPWMPRTVAFTRRRGAADHRSRRRDGGDDRS